MNTKKIAAFVLCMSSLTNFVGSTTRQQNVKNEEIYKTLKDIRFEGAVLGNVDLDGNNKVEEIKIAKPVKKSFLSRLIRNVSSVLKKSKKCTSDVSSAASGHAIKLGKEGVNGVKFYGPIIVNGAVKHGLPIAKGAVKLGVHGAKVCCPIIVNGAVKHGLPIAKGAVKLGKEGIKGAIKHGLPIVKDAARLGANGVKAYGPIIVNGAVKLGKEGVNVALLPIVKNGVTTGQYVLKTGREGLIAAIASGQHQRNNQELELDDVNLGSGGEIELEDRILVL